MRYPSPDRPLSPLPSRRGRVLVVEDDVFTRTLVGHTLRAAGHEVELCASREEALPALRRGAFDVVLLSNTQAGPSSGNTIASIRALPGAAADTPVVLIAPEAAEEVVVGAREEGADAYLPWPFALSTLREMVDSFLVDYEMTG